MLSRRAGHDLLTNSRIDAVGITYITVCATWTLIIFTGLGIFLRNRKLDFIRMRRPLLVASALAMIHVYLCIVLLQYPLNASWGCSQSFWFMSIYLPLGIALWAIANVQVLNLSSIQKNILSEKNRPLPKPPLFHFRLASWWAWLVQTNVATRVSIGVALAFLLQALVSIIIYPMSRKFHPSFGLFSRAGTPAECRKGWEWAITIFGQAVWTWVFGPILLYRIRNIHDVHHWRLQTTLAVAFSLPGLPMWIAALYSESFHTVDLYWPASMWLAPGLVMMEALALVFPLLEVYQLKAWYRSVQNNAAKQDSLTQMSSRATSIDGSGSRALLTRQWSLEQMLDSEEFLHFAATRDFTAENIIFLRKVRDWKAKYDHMKSEGSLSDMVLSNMSKLSLYIDAAMIFADTISLRTAPYPINLDSKAYQILEQRFPTKDLWTKEAFIAPFSNFESQTELVRVGPSKSSSGDGMVTFEGQRMRPSMDALNGFDETVFDRAEQCVTYLVRTNTWPRYVRCVNRTANFPTLSI